jgi:hypothetical protein
MVKNFIFDAIAIDIMSCFAMTSEPLFIDIDIQLRVNLFFPDSILMNAHQNAHFFYENVHQMPIFFDQMPAFW